MKTFKEWLVKNLKEELQDIASDGCESGFPGLTYYSETSSLYDRYQKDIWKMLSADATNMGDANVLGFIASLNGAKNVSDDETFKNLLVWYAAEKLADEIVNQ
jgi:hypothetical protein